MSFTPQWWKSWDGQPVPVETFDRVIAIGDIHGCANALSAVIEAIRPAEQDLIVMLGDYIDRGPDSKSVIDQVLALSERCHVMPLIGNHETMLLQGLDELVFRDFWLSFGGKETLASYGGAVEQIPDEHIEFMRSCHKFFETDTTAFIHANYQPNAPFAEQDEQVAFWLHLSEYVPAAHVSGKRVFVGHTPQKSGDNLDTGHLECIDTHCFGDGYLTAMDVKTNQLWQADKAGQLRT